MKEFLRDSEKWFKSNHSEDSWNSVSTPFSVWPSIFDKKSWNTQPELKLKRLDMWKFFVNWLKDNSIKNLIDIGTASGQFPLLCLNSGIEAYGIDPKYDMLYSNKEDWNQLNININDYLYLGSVESFINTKKNINIECVSLLNYLHGDDWNNRDIKFIQSVIDFDIEYLITSNSKNPQCQELLSNNFEKILTYEQISDYENHFIFRRRV